MNIQEKELTVEIEQHLRIAAVAFFDGRPIEGLIDLNAAIDLLETMRNDTDDAIDLAQHAPAEDEAEAAAHDARDNHYMAQGG